MRKMVQMMIAVTVPLGFAISFACSGWWLCALAAIVAMYILVGSLPAFKKQRVRGIFVLLFFTVLPINISLTARWFVCENAWVITNILRAVIGTFMMLSLEEIAGVVIAQIIWK